MKDRLLSIDVMRGMTIFFMIVVNTPGSWSHVYAPLLHAKWDGLTPTDLVFPFFVYIVGLSMAFSFRKFEKKDRSAWVGKVIRRTLLIFLIGIGLNWFPFFDESFSELRIFGVLQRIALAYGFAGLIIIFAKESWLSLITGLILLAYWGILLIFGGPDPLSLEENAVRAMDLFLIGENHIYHGYGIPFEPEGLLSTLPAIGTVLLGFLTGKILQKDQSLPKRMKTILIQATAVLLVGIAWNYFGFPVNKPLWSSSYVLVSAALGAYLLLFLMYLIDIGKWTKWSFIFYVFGRNPLISYVMSGIVITIFSYIRIDGMGLYGWLYENIFQVSFGFKLGSFIQALVYTMFIWLFAWYLHIRNILVKI